MCCSIYEIDVLKPKAASSGSENNNYNSRAMLVTALAMVALAAGVASPADIAAQAAPATPHKLVWSDEFDGTALNATNWNVRNNESHCCQLGKQELELYMADEVSVADGFLHLRTRHRSMVGPTSKGTVQTYNFTSGWIDTKGKFSRLGGRFEANCSLPTTAATGIWPAFWLLPEGDACWPTGGEIDIFELDGPKLFNEVFASYHWAPPGAANCGRDKAPIPGAGHKPAGAGANWQTGWHVYAVEWETAAGTQKLTYFLDGVPYFTRTAEEVDLPPSAMYVIFDQAVDPVLFPPTRGHLPPAYEGDGVELRVDWVRVWEL